MALKIEPVEGGVRFWVKVVPGSSRDRIVGELGNALKVAVSAPPEGGKANAAVIKLLAEKLNVPRQRVEIISGHSRPRKQVRVNGLSVDEMITRLAAG